MAIWDPLVDSVFESLKEAAKDLWEEGKENLPFLKEIALSVAEHTYQSQFGPPEYREAHKSAIKADYTAFEGRVHSESMRIKAEKREIFMTVLTTIAKTAFNFVKHFVGLPGA